jgi:hypothetical protein
MKIYFPKISLGNAKLRKPTLANPFTSKSVTLRVPVLKVKKPKLGFKLRSPFTKA